MFSFYMIAKLRMYTMALATNLVNSLCDSVLVNAMLNPTQTPVKYLMTSYTKHAPTHSLPAIISNHLIHHQHQHLKMSILEPSPTMCSIHPIRHTKIIPPQRTLTLRRPPAGEPPTSSPSLAINVITLHLHLRLPCPKVILVFGVNGGYQINEEGEHIKREDERDRPF